MRRVKKIAVLRANGLGDFIFTVPALTALRETFPDAQIVYLGKDWHRQFLLKRKTLVDNIIVIPPMKGISMDNVYTDDQRQIEAFYKKMQEENFDVAIQLHGGGQYSNTFIENLGASYTIGTKTDNAQPLNEAIPYEYYQNEILRWLEVVSLIGASTKHISPQLTATKDDVNEAKKILGNNKKFIVIHPGATDLKRRWPFKRFARVGDYFAQKGFRIIITGSGDEREIVKNTIHAMTLPADNFYGKLSINALTGLLSVAALVVANDTGPLHLANALGTTTVGIYWCANLINAAPPFRNNSVCLSSWIIHCPICQTDCASGYPFDTPTSSCKHEISFVTKTTVTEVITAAEKMLLRKAVKG